MLEKWAYELLNRIQSLSDAELSQLFREIDSVTETNCGWDTYELAFGLRDMVCVTVKSRRDNSAYWNARRKPDGSYDLFLGA